MKLYYIGVLKNDQKPAVQLCAEYELGEFSRFTRNEYKNFMTMFSKTVAERTKPGQRQVIEEQDLTFHCYSRSEAVAGVIISKGYPDLTAQYILGKVLDEFLTAHPKAAISSTAPDNEISFPLLRKYLNDYQDPSKVGSIASIKQELDETKIILHKTIESVLARSEKLDDLVAKSTDLTGQSKMFYKQAKKQNSCCVVM